MQKLLTMIHSFIEAHEKYEAALAALGPDTHEASAFPEERIRAIERQFLSVSNAFAHCVPSALGELDSRHIPNCPQANLIADSSMLGELTKADNQNSASDPLYGNMAQLP